MDLNHLAAFVAVARAGSFTAAAAALGQPKSTVSRSVAALEAALGQRLVLRTTRSVGLSTAGAALLDRVAGPISALRAAADELPGADGEPAGLLRLTTTADFAEAFLSGLVARYLARYPAVRVELRLTERVVDLNAEGVDLAIRFLMGPAAPMGDAGLVARRVGESRVGLFAAPAWVARRGAPRQLSDLRADDLVLHRAVAERRPLFGAAGDLPRDAPPRVLVDEMSFVRGALAQGVGVGPLPTFLAAPEVEAGRLVPVLPKLSSPAGAVVLLMPGGRQPLPKVRAFVDLFVGSFRGW